MYKEAVYNEVVAEVLDELREHGLRDGCRRCPRAHHHGPRLGFAKEAVHTYEVLARLDEFSGLGRPLLVWTVAEAVPEPSAGCRYRRRSVSGRPAAAVAAAVSPAPTSSAYTRSAR